MQKPWTAAVIAIAAGIVLSGTAYSQTAQAPPAKTQPAPASKSAAAPATKKTTPATTAKTPTRPALTLKTQKDKFSYALGMNLGSNLQRQSVPVDADILARGVKDGLAGGKTLLTPEEARAVLTEEQNELRKQLQEKMQVVAEANKKDGETFLTANKVKDGVITLPSGLQYKVLTQGTGAKPTSADSVVCNYRGTLLNGTEFDSSYKRGQPATFPVTGVIKGWTEALQLMPVGSKWQLFVPSELAYGDHPPTPAIPPGSTLIFEVELVSIQEKNPAKLEINPAEKAPEEKKEDKKQ